MIERPPSVELPTMRGLRAQVTPLDVACEGQVLAGTRLHYSATFGDDARPMFGDVRDPWVYLVALDPDPARATALDRTLAYAPQPYHAGDRVALEPMRFPGQPVPCMKVASLLAASPPSPAPSGLSDAFLADLRARLMERYGSAP